MAFVYSEVLEKHLHTFYTHRHNAAKAITYDMNT